MTKENHISPPPVPPPVAWDKHAPLYEQVWERSTILWGRDALVLADVPAVHDTDHPRPRFLEVACGPGGFAIAAAQMGYDVTATDFSVGMIERLQQKLRGHSDLKIDARVVDGQTLEGLADESFDVVASMFGIITFPDRGAGWQSALRVIKPGGRLLAGSWHIESANFRVLLYCLQNARDREGVLPRPELGAISKGNPTFHAEMFAKELVEFGFEDVAVHSIGHAMSFRSGEEAVRATLDNGAFAQVTASKDPVSVALSALDYFQLLVDGLDPFDAANTLPLQQQEGRRVQDHALWRKPFAFQSVGLIATARKAGP